MEIMLQLTTMTLITLMTMMTMMTMIMMIKCLSTTKIDIYSANLSANGITKNFVRKDMFPDKFA